MTPTQKPLLISIGIIFVTGLAYITYANRPVMDLNNVPASTNFSMTGTMVSMGGAPMTEIGCDFLDTAKPGDKLPCNRANVSLGLAPLLGPTPNETLYLKGYSCDAREVLVYKGKTEYEVTGPCTNDVKIGGVYTATGIFSGDNQNGYFLQVETIRERTEPIPENEPVSSTFPSIATGEPNPSAPAPKNDDDNKDGGDDDEEDGEERVDRNTTTTTPTTTSPSTTSTTYSLADVAAHSDSTSCWSIVSGNVYDLTEWANRHPGGEKPILNMCGKDATSNFDRKHGGSSTAKAALVLLKIGALK